MSMEFEDLRVFLAAAEHGSFGRAASELGLAQPSVSNRIAVLERRLGRSLFTRSTRGAALTPAGERLVPYARRARQLIDEAVAAARTAHHRPPIRLLLSASYAPVLLPLVVDTLAGSDRPVSISYDHGPAVVRAIASGDADLGFLTPCPHPSTVTLRALGTSRVVAAVAPQHPLAALGRPTLADLTDHPIAVAVWGDGADVFREQLPANARVWRVFPVPAAAQLARDRGYVALAPQAALAAELRSHTLTEVPIGDLPTADVALALAFLRTSAIPVTDLIARARRALRAPRRTP